MPPYGFDRWTWDEDELLRAVCWLERHGLRESVAMRDLTRAAQHVTGRGSAARSLAAALVRTGRLALHTARGARADYRLLAAWLATMLGASL